MKPFDLEAAKRGEPIQASYDGEWYDANFIGLSPIRDPITAGMPVIYNPNFDQHFSPFTVDKLRMKPVKRTVFVVIGDVSGGGGTGAAGFTGGCSWPAYRSEAYSVREIADAYAAMRISGGGKAIVREVEIEE